ncbi:hypothetical protein [Amycolatopsis lurida]|uniref:Oxidoreductase n=1 Tax=Amycolatopsis lurida NRRL 2430 TaxID=1460371 RepID=A0A2P2FYZ4_AMYLU|nr:hypothetical protein [Amycolatopsis lurida]KFU81948.1 hypothetical protein BB31_06295 [Amycolatopsis lurida NRRL 2430]
MTLPPPTPTFGSIELFGAQIGGQLWLTDSHVESPNSDSYAIKAPSIHVTGGFYARRLTAIGGVNLWGADIGASLDLHGSTLSTTDHPALRTHALAARLDVNITNCRIEGGIDLFGARVGGQLWLEAEMPAAVLQMRSAQRRPLRHV